MKPVLLAAALLLAASPVLAQKPQSLTQRWTGIWFGTGQPEDRSEMFIDTFNADGSFRDHHRWCFQGKVRHESFEVGRWRIEGNILVIDIATVNGQPEPRQDRYRVNSVDAAIQDYTYMRNNFGYKARKVNAAYKMPPCDLAS